MDVWNMTLWMTWINIVWQLRAGFSRDQTFMWAIVVLAGFSIRRDLWGVTSFVRCLGIQEKHYQSLRDFFHSKSIKLNLLTVQWVKVCLKIFSKHLVTFNGRIVLLADGIKIPKEGQKMPAVKLTHQESMNNSKPEYVMAHSCQCISLLIEGVGLFFSVPLAARIHEGVQFSNRDQRTVIDKLLSLLLELELSPSYLVADAYYAARKLVLGLVKNGHHLISRVRSNAVAYNEYTGKRKGPGRPKKYGEKIELRSIFKKLSLFQTAISPLYDDKNVTIQYYSLDLLWRPLAFLVRFVWVIHPTRGHWVLLSSDLKLSPMDIITLYGNRFKIEVMFRQSIYAVGAFGYRFWLKCMDELKRGMGTQYLHRKTTEYRDAVRGKIAAYECHIQLGLIAQGLLQYLSVCYHSLVWEKYSSWMRTMKIDRSPSESVVAEALRNCYPEFLASSPDGHTFKKFLLSKIDFGLFPRRKFKMLESLGEKMSA